MEYLSIWAALLSTILAVIKVWETWQKRMRLQTGYNFTSDPDIGNEVIIQNPSDTPVMISYWELLWARRSWPKLRSTNGRFPDEGRCDITIAPHSSHTLRFVGEDHWDGRPDGGQKLFLRLHIVGRRPVTMVVYKYK